MGLAPGGTSIHWPTFDVRGILEGSRTGYHDAESFQPIGSLRLVVKELPHAGCFQDVKFVGTRTVMH